MKKKNGKIELLRFLFCIAILCCHISLDYGKKYMMITKAFSFFIEGRIGVDFFFLLTGYLTGARIWRTKDDRAALGESTFQFIKGKIRTILPYHITAIVMMILYTAWRRQLTAAVLTNGLPNIFLVNMFGFQGKSLVTVEWYISSMILALLILYPLARKYYDGFVYIAAPVLGGMCVGVVLQAAGAMGKPINWLGITHLGNIRAVGEIALGICVFELTRRLKECSLTQWQRGLMTAAEAGGYLLVLYYMVSDNLPKKTGGVMVFVLCLLVGLSFSGLTFGSEWFDRPLFYFLGSCSLPIYLQQNLVRKIAKRYWHPVLGYRKLAVVIVAVTILAGILTYLGIQAYQKWRSQRKNPA